ncbi:SMC family ATPase [Shewanella youngdeokensis]|uniref:SMC family ATPase n=1 Tax=Shewanella youngdeokensis TaxID=2999068 RepID=A0ABZ0JUV5_9GAMM|nr:SMC family ATPase [Shewanella sp. DAU334]
MRPIKLSMAAFGPFSGQQETDFEALGQHPLFLINGPTGAGKTTLLDAMCFALYGKTTGDEREGSQMRCDNAQDNLLTEVTFSFALADNQYRIRRVPEQQRAKKSGDGYTVQKPEAQLFKIAPDGTEHLLVASKVSEATSEIEQLTGLDADQFRQVMVLPQGKFRELLMADSKDREKIFSQLFQTQIYRRIEDKLKYQAQAIKSAVRDHRNKRDGMLHNVALESDEALSTQLAELAPQLAASLAAKEQAKSALIDINKQFETAKLLMRDFDALDKFNHTAAALMQQKPVIDQRQLQLERGQKAQQLKPILDVSLARESELVQAAAAVTKAQADKQRSEQVLASSLSEFNQLADFELKSQQIQNEQQQLTQLVPQLQGLDRLQAELTLARTKREQAKQKGINAKGVLDTLLADKTAAQEQVPQLELIANELVDAQQALTAQTELIERFQQWQKGQTEVSQTQTALADAKNQGLQLKTTFDKAREHHQQLQLVWHRGQAAMLAQKLTQGQPCPVCGSAEHPNPAQSEQQLPSEEQLQQAQQAEEQANEALTQARTRYSGLSTKLQEQLKSVTELKLSIELKIGDFAALTLEVLQSQQRTLTQQVNQANHASKQLVSLRAQLQAWQVNEQGLRSSLEAERDLYRDVDTKVASLEGQLAQILAAIPEQYRSLDTLNNALGELKQQLAAVQQRITAIRESHTQALEQDAACAASLTSSQESQTKAATLNDKAQAELTAHLSGSGFNDKPALTQALLSEAELKAITAEVNQYQQDCVANQANLAQLKDKLQQQTKPELHQLEARLLQTQTEQQQAEQQWQSIQGRVTQLQETQQQLDDADAKAKLLEDEYAVVGTLADVANGQTGNKVSLQRFVLSVLLDDVLLEASERLQLMSKGRYRLIRKEDRAKGNKASGLELEVEDAYTSKVRPVATLSGGESFMAALSMALGLSDVVQAYAGGIKLDTLFIDEGFGSLDQDSLDLAVRTLMDLQSAGRMIGVISHVSEMKEQIGTRIDINKSAQGSEISIVLP